MFLAAQTLIATVWIALCVRRCVGGNSVQLLSTEEPLVVQTDLIFPKKDTVYKPANPFPVVFALHQYLDVWQYEPVINWRLHVLSPIGNWELGDAGSVGWTAHKPDVPSSATQLTVDVSYDIVRTTYPTQLRLEYEFRIGPRPNQCSGQSLHIPSNETEQSTRAFFTGDVTFNISNETGVVPDFMSGDRCSTPLGAVGYLGPNATNASCPYLAWPQPDTNPCMFSVDPQSNNLLIELVNNKSNCRSLKFPSYTDICPRDLGSIGHKVQSGCWFLLSMVFGMIVILL